MYAHAFQSLHATLFTLPTLGDPGQLLQPTAIAIGLAVFVFVRRLFA